MTPQHGKKQILFRYIDMCMTNMNIQFFKNKNSVYGYAKCDYHR